MLLQNIRARIGARLNSDKEAGFTLIELLVVMLILGILAAIALPAFFNQKDKATDSKAKANAHSAQVAMETCISESAGIAKDCDYAKLSAIEPTLPTGTAAAGVESLAVTPDATGSGYTVAVKSTVGNVFKITRSSTGATTFKCTVASSNRGGCPGSGTAEGNWN